MYHYLHYTESTIADLCTSEGLPSMYNFPPPPGLLDYVYVPQISNSATDSRMDLDLDFNLAIVEH